MLASVQVTTYWLRDLIVQPSAVCLIASAGGTSCECARTHQIVCETMLLIANVSALNCMCFPSLTDFAAVCVCVCVYTRRQHYVNTRTTNKQHQD